MIMTPADYVIYSFGGVRKTARLLKVSPSTVCRWSTRENQFGNRGNIPSKWHKIILGLAKKHRVSIKETDLIKGKKVCQKNIRKE